jgi:hypothetical protein
LTASAPTSGASAFTAQKYARLQPHNRLSARAQAIHRDERSRVMALSSLSGCQGNVMTPGEDHDPYSPEAIARAYAAVPERNTGDALLRTAQQHHVALSTMADTKANILITVSSIVLTMVLGKMNDPNLRLAMMTLAGFVLAALLLAVIAVLPKYRPLRIKPGAPLPPHFNLLFFGHFAELPRERFLTEMAEALQPDGSVYEIMARDVYGIGYYLAHYKYRFLRLSYLFFLGGFVCACVVEAGHLLLTSA